MKQIKLDEDIKQYIRIFVLVVLIIFFQCETNSIFLSSLNLSHIGMQNYHQFFLAIGMFFVIITYNVDLSIGVVASLISGLSAIYIFIFYSFHKDISYEGANYSRRNYKSRKAYYY